MKKTYKYLSIFFTILTFIGAGYVLMNNGYANAGYAVIPMLFALIFSILQKKKINSSDKFTTVLG
ncbi:hypothetical protein SD457_09975 [Coprobacillaceae bacterium CR2/5/TPMF4]|nr:hypothetical protein SD457_09975 [Coprobacillaceae bacterium CR2/5/TPMF4]